jgi:glycosyltransferase involved in cell wall biosynthesis
MRPEVLLVSKDLSLRGGVTNFCRLFLKKFDGKGTGITHFTQGERGMIFERRNLPIARHMVYFVLYIFDLLRFGLLLTFRRRRRIVHLNPSMIPVPLIRDAPFLIISRMLGRKAVVLYHGWDTEFEPKMRKGIRGKAFRAVYGSANSHVVLSNEFARSLSRYGFPDVTVLRTMFDADLLARFKKGSEVRREFVYLGRLQAEKGIFEIAEAAHILRDRGRRVRIHMVGWFSSRETEIRFRDKLRDWDLEEDVILHGYVTDDEKAELLSENAYFAYPSWYFEGCPTVIMEALGAGMFVISSDIAAVKEVVKDGKMGFIVKKKDPMDLADKMERALEIDDIDVIRAGNRTEAMRKYESRIITERVADIYRKLLPGGERE